MIVHVPDRDIDVELNEYLHSSYIKTEDCISDESLFPTISPIVEKNRSTIEKLAPLCKRMYNIK